MRVRSSRGVAAARSFRLPEILDNIFSCVDHPSTLAACARVNWTWHREAIKWLWLGESKACVDDVWTLPWNDHSWTANGMLKEFVLRPDRLKYYLKYTKFFAIIFDEHPRNACSNNAFWRSDPFEYIKPVRMTIDSRRCGDLRYQASEFLSETLRPSIRTLRIQNCHLTKFVLDQIQQGAPNVSSLYLQGRELHAPSTELCKFFQSLPSLSRICLCLQYATFDLANDPLWDHFTCRPNLQYLKVLFVFKMNNSDMRWLTGSDPGSDLEGYAETATDLESRDAFESHHKFAHLEGLELVATDARLIDLRKIVCSITNLQCLHVDWDVQDPTDIDALGRDGMPHMFNSILTPAMAGWSQLRHLHFCFPEKVIISASSIVTIARGCPNLSILNLPPMDSDSSDNDLPSITMDQFRELTRCLPSIERLGLGGHVLRCFCEDLVHAIEHCPFLVDLELHCGIDIRQIAHIPVKKTTVLSHLERLDVFDLLRNSSYLTYFTSAVSNVGYHRGPLPQRSTHPGWRHRSNEKRANDEQHRLFMTAVHEVKRLIDARLPNLKDVGIDKDSRLPPNDPRWPDPRFFSNRLEYTFLVIDEQIRERAGWNDEEYYEQRDLRKTLAPELWHDEDD